MNYSEDFKTTLTTKGLPAEREFKERFINFLINKHGTTKEDYICKEINNIDGDLSITFLKNLIKGEPITFLFEVKNDEKGSKTGNIYIELESRNKLSGLLASKSDYWAIRFKYKDIEEMKNIDVFYVINKTRLLKGYLDKKYIRDASGGDNDLNNGVLFKYDVIEEMVNEGIAAKDGSMILNCKNNI